MFVGNGVNLASAWAEVRELAELIEMPVATSLVGKGAFPESHPLALGLTGIWGTRVANDTTRAADVILAVGTAFGEAECSSWNPKYTFDIPASKLVQIDADPQEIGKIYPVEVGLVGDAKATLRALIDELGAHPPAVAPDGSRLADVARRRAAWHAEIAASQREATTPIHPARLLKAIGATAPKDTVFVTDVGWNKNGAGQQLPTDTPMSFITSGGLATMGFAPPAAIGAKIGAPHRKVVCLVGDGGFVSVMGALATAVELGVPVLWVLFNNFCFSTIRTVGTQYFGSTYGTEFTRPDGTPYNPDFMLMSQAFGIKSALVTEPVGSRDGALGGHGRRRTVSPRSAHPRRRARCRARATGTSRTSSPDRYRAPEIVQRWIGWASIRTDRAGGHSGPMLNTCDTTREPGLSSRTSFGRSRSLRLCSRYSVTTVASDRSVAKKLPVTNRTRSETPAAAALAVASFTRAGSISTPTPRAPYFFAAVMTMRPSPDPRS